MAERIRGKQPDLTGSGIIHSYENDRHILVIGFDGANYLASHANAWILASFRVIADVANSALKTPVHQVFQFSGEIRALGLTPGGVYLQVRGGGYIVVGLSSVQESKDGTIWSRSTKGIRFLCRWRCGWVLQQSGNALTDRRNARHNQEQKRQQFLHQAETPEAISQFGGGALMTMLSASHHCFLGR